MWASSAASISTAACSGQSSVSWHRDRSTVGRAVGNARNRLGGLNIHQISWVYWVGYWRARVLRMVGSSAVSGGCPAQGFGGGVVVAQPVGIAVEGEHYAAVQQPVQECGRDGGVSQDFSPRPHWPVGG